MANKKENQSGGGIAFLAVLCWSFHFPLLIRRISETSPPVAFYFHSLLWATIAAAVLLTLFGRVEDLRLLNRKSGAITLLVLTGGYGFWALMAVAMHAEQQEAGIIELIFYLGPMFFVFLSTFSPQGASRGRIWMAITGYAGVVLMLYNTAGISLPALSVLLPAVGTAFCWAVFSLAAGSLLDRNEILAATAIILSISTACLLLTCLAMRIDLLAIAREDIWISMITGAVTITGGLGLWMKCMSMQDSPANAATWWYGAPVFGTLWYHFFTDISPGWMGLTGAVIIMLSFKIARSGRERTESTFGDMISKSR